METKELARYIVGYIIGIAVFVAGIPFCLYLIAKAFPLAFTAHDMVRQIAGIPLLVVGIIFALWSNKDLLMQGRGGPTDAFNVAVSPRPKHLVTAGPYRYTRNPMVFGALSAYFGIAVLLNSAVCLVILIIFTYVARIYLRLTEEKRLERDFGDEYRQYRQKVPMLFPLHFRRRIIVKPPK